MNLLENSDCRFAIRDDIMGHIDAESFAIEPILHLDAPAIRLVRRVSRQMMSQLSPSLPSLYSFLVIFDDDSIRLTVSRPPSDRKLVTLEYGDPELFAKLAYELSICGIEFTQL